MTKEEKLYRCFGCANLRGGMCVKLTTFPFHADLSIFEIENCNEFTCPKNCSCDTQEGEPLHCEPGPEELEFYLFEVIINSEEKESDN